MWDVVSTKDGVGHRCFTSIEVTPPIEGELYGALDGQGRGSESAGEISE